MFDNKTLLITGGTGSFGNAVLDRFLYTNIKEIRILSRDEKKQDDMRIKLASDKVKFYIGEHPETGQTGVILMERDISDGNIFSRIDPRSESTQFFMLAENVAQMKFRYYQMKKLPPQEVGPDKSVQQFSGKWVNRVFMDPFELSLDNSNETNPVLAFEKINKISLPRAVEITIGVIPPPKPGEEGQSKELEPVFSPPIIVLLNSGMEFAKPPIEKEEDNEKA